MVEVLVDVEPREQDVQRHQRREAPAAAVELAHRPRQCRQRQHVPVVGVDHEPHEDEQRPDGERLDLVGVLKRRGDQRREQELHEDERDAAVGDVDVGARLLDLAREGPAIPHLLRARLVELQEHGAERILVRVILLDLRDVDALGVALPDAEAAEHQRRDHQRDRGG